MAYREGDEGRGLVPRPDAIPVKSVVISLRADCSGDALIAAHHTPRGTLHINRSRQTCLPAITPYSLKYCAAVSALAGMHSERVI